MRIYFQTCVYLIQYTSYNTVIQNTVKNNEERGKPLHDYFPAHTTTITSTTLNTDSIHVVILL